jgi:hypothetical protein
MTRPLHSFTPVRPLPPPPDPLTRLEVLGHKLLGHLPHVVHRHKAGGLDGQQLEEEPGGQLPGGLDVLDDVGGHLGGGGGAFFLEGGGALMRERVSTAPEKEVGGRSSAAAASL